ncbi:hypothetical protein ACHAXR_012179 [Thalassiosira sp. AJA248-18]
MPTLTETGPEDAPPAAPAPSTKSSGAGSRPNPSAKKPRASDDSASSRSRATPSSSGARSPAPPPDVPEIQLKLWRAVLERRKKQIQRLSHSYLLSFANDIISDLLKSRYEANEYSKDKENRQGGTEMDLAGGHYSSHLLTKQPPPTDISAAQIGLHLLALFYRSVDDRLPHAVRKHGIDSLRRACQKLEFWVSKWEAGEKSSNGSKAKEAPTEGGANSGKKKRKRMDSTHGDGGINQSKPRRESASHESIDSDDGSDKRMRKDPPELMNNLATRASGNAQRPVYLPAQQHGDEKDGSNDGIEENKSEKGGQKEIHRPNQTVVQASVTEQRTASTNNLPPQHQKELTRNSLEKEKASERSPHVSASQQRKNSNHAVHTQKESAAVTQKKPQDGREKSSGIGEGKDLSQPKQNNDGVSKSSGVQQSLGKRFVHPQPKQGLKDNSSSGQSISQRLDSSDGATPQRGPTISTHPKPQKKDHPKQNQTDLGGPRLTEAGTMPLPQNGRDEGLSGKEKPSKPPSSASASQRRNNNDPRRNPAMITQSRTQQKDPPQPSQSNGGAPRVTERAGPISLPSQSQQGRSEHSSEKEKNSEAPSRNSASHSNDKVFHKQGPAVTAQNKSMGNNDRGGDMISSSNTNSRSANISNNASQANATSRKETPATSNKKRDDCNAHQNAKKVAIATTPRPPAESQNKLNGASNAENANTGKALDEDVIDLTSDSPTPECFPSVPNDAPSSSTQPIKQNDEEKVDNNRMVPQQPPSPPASPLPFPTIHNPAPSPRPNPKPFSDMSCLLFHADNVEPTASGSLNCRPSCALTFDAGFHLDGSGSCLDDELCIDVCERLKTWDPYWKIVEELGSHMVPAAKSQAGHVMTMVGTRTSSCQPAQRTVAVVPDHPSSCARVSIDLPREVSLSKISNRDSSGKTLPVNYRPWGVKWGSLSHPYKDNKNRQRDCFQTRDRRLVVRTLPLQRTSKDIKKRADGHLWPKGTFLQLKRGDTEKVLSILQRKQQSHAPLEWKGMSHPLDLTVDVMNTHVPIEIKLCSKEVLVATNDDHAKGSPTLAGSYALHVAICEYVAPDDLYDQLMGKVAGGDVTIPKISLRSARKMAKDYLANQMVSIVDSDDEDDNAKSDQGKIAGGKSMTFSLLCPISKTAMCTPVRGRHCKHMQCFDLKNFLHANKIITGGRWRCGVCESFLNVRDLVHCGLFQVMLNTLGEKVSGARDRVSLRSDGTFTLMDANKLRYANKRGGGNSTATKTESNKDQEVIELV